MGEMRPAFHRSGRAGEATELMVRGWALSSSTLGLGDPGTRTAGRGGIALCWPWALPEVSPSALLSLQASSLKHPSLTQPTGSTPSQTRPLPWRGSRPTCCIAWAALIFPLLTIGSYLGRRQPGAPRGRPSQAQVRGSATPVV